MKCTRSADKTRVSFCEAMDAVMLGDSNNHGAGISVVVMTTLTTGKQTVIGVQARKKFKDRPILFNWCPYCGVSLRWWPRQRKTTS